MSHATAYGTRDRKSSHTGGMTCDWLTAFLPRSESKWVFVCVTYFYSLALTNIVYRILVLVNLWPTRIDNHGIVQYVRPGIDNSDAITILVVAPILESVELIAGVELLRWIGLRAVYQAIGASAVLCGFHGLQSIVSAVSAAPVFLIQAGTYIYWIRRGSRLQAGAMVLGLHLLLNLLAGVGLLVGTLRR